MKLFLLSFSILLLVSRGCSEGLLNPTGADDGAVQRNQIADSCAVADSSSEVVLAGVILDWDSSLLCAEVPDSGSYEITVTLANDPGSGESVTLDTLVLTHTTPRPRGRAPEATLSEVEGLPGVLGAGEKISLTARGSYELARTDEGNKANLHFQARGHGVTSNEPFRLGINLHLRAPGATE